MANRRQEERERLRQVREEREKGRTSSGRRRLFLAYGAAGVIALAVVIGIVSVVASGVSGDDEGQAHIEVASGSTNEVKPDTRDGTPPPAPRTTDLEQAARKAGCEVRLNLPSEGKTHIARGSDTPDYKTSPPTSGNHTAPPYQQADGAYSEMPGEAEMVHALEHGRMEIQYSPDLPDDAQLELKGLYDTMYGGTLLFPNDNMDYEVAAAAWTNLLGCDQYKGAATLDAIRAFGKKVWGKYGGEPVNAFGLKGPTPLEPQS